MTEPDQKLEVSKAHAVAHLAAIVESSDDAIIGKDLSGIITTWNRAAERIYGYSETEAIGQPITILIPKERLSEETVILEKIRRGEQVQIMRPSEDAKTAAMSPFL